MGKRQLIGSFKIALAGQVLADVSGSVSSMVLNTTHANVAVPAVLLTAQSSTEAGEKSQSLTIRLHSGIEAAGLWARLFAIIQSVDSLADWEAVFDPGAVSPDNPRYSGTAVAGNALVLLNLDLGADVGALRQQTITMPLQGPATVATS